MYLPHTSPLRESLATSLSAVQFTLCLSSLPHVPLRRGYRMTSSWKHHLPEHLFLSVFPSLPLHTIYFVATPPPASFVSTM